MFPSRYDVCSHLSIFICLYSVLAYCSPTMLFSFPSIPKMCWFPLSLGTSTHAFSLLMDGTFFHHILLDKSYLPSRSQLCVTSSKRMSQTLESKLGCLNTVFPIILCFSFDKSNPIMYNYIVYLFLLFTICTYTFHNGRNHVCWTDCFKPQCQPRICATVNFQSTHSLN